MENFSVKKFLFAMSLLVVPFFSYADFIIKQTGKIKINCPVVKKIEINSNSIEIDKTVLSKIKKLDDFVCDEVSLSKKVIENFPKEKKISIKKISIVKLFRDQTWLKVNEDIYVAQIGDSIGNIVIMGIDFEKKLVETSQGEIQWIYH